MSLVICEYTGATPGADANTYTLFSSVTAFQGAKMAQGAGLKRCGIDIKHSGTITLRGYKSSNRGTTWEQVYDSGAVASPGATESTILDFWFEPYADWKIDLVNGGAAQTGFTVDIALSDERSSNG